MKNRCKFVRQDDSVVCSREGCGRRIKTDFHPSMVHARCLTAATLPVQQERRKPCGKIGRAARRRDYIREIDRLLAIEPETKGNNRLIDLLCCRLVKMDSGPPLK